MRLSGAPLSGERLNLAFETMGIGQYRLAKSLGVPVQRIHGRRAITADTALRLARFFAMEA